jgi:hypothetical protein
MAMGPYKFEASRGDLAYSARIRQPAAGSTGLVVDPGQNALVKTSESAGKERFAGAFRREV